MPLISLCCIKLSSKVSSGIPAFDPRSEPKFNSRACGQRFQTC